MNKRMVLLVLILSSLLLWTLSSLFVSFVKAVPDGFWVEENCLTKQDFVNEATASPADTVNLVFEGAGGIELYYDDGTAEWEYSWPSAGGMFAVRFTPPASGQLIECSFYISSAPDTFKVHVLDTDKNDVITPFPETPTSTGWFHVDLSTSGISVSSGVDFYVAMESTAVSAPWLGADNTSAPDGRSWDYYGESWSQWWEDDYMIRAVIETGVAGVDLKITDVYLEPSEPMPGENVTFYADAENQGTENATDFIVDLYLDEELLAWGSFSLAAGENDTYWYYPWTAISGSHTVRWVTDATDKIVESNEDNNEMSDTFMVGGLADLKITDIYWDPLEPMLGDDVTFYADAENQGTENATDFWVDLYLDEELIASDTFSLAAGENDTYWNIDPWTATLGSHTVRWVIDATDVIVESNEDNNEMSDTFMVEYGLVEGSFWDAKIENLVDDDVDGYYEQIDLCWDADTPLNELTVFVKIYGRHEDGTSQFIIQDDPYTIYNYDVDWRYCTLTDGATGYWDFRLELYDYATDTLLDILDYEEDPDISNVPMDEVVEYVLTVQTPYGDVTVNVDGEEYTTDAYGKVQVTVSPGSTCTVEVPTYIPTVSGSRESFTQWSDGDQSNPRTVLVDSDLTLVAEYTTQYLVAFAQTGLDATATGTVVTVNGDRKTLSDLPYTTWVDSGDSISYSYSDPVPSSVGDKRSKLADVTGPTSPITVTGPVTITGNYKTQYYLTMSTNFGTVTPGSGWHDAGSTVQIGASAPSVVEGEQYVWLGWTGTGSGSYSNMDNPTSITMDGPITETATWRHEYYLTITSLYGSPTPTSGWFESGKSITASITSPVSESADTRYACTGWTGTGSVSTSGSTTSVTFAIDEPSSITWNWKTQYLLTVRTDPTGISPQPNVSPSGPWYDDGTLVTCTAQEVSEHEFDHWTVDETKQGSQVNPITITMDSPHTATSIYHFPIHKPLTWQDYITRPEIIGLLIGSFSVIATVTAFVATRRKRGRVKSLLDEIDDAYFRYKKNARRCEAELYRLKDVVLEEYKSGKIVEDSYNILTKRIDDYIKEVLEQNK